jgi:hypothetical protein
LLAPVVKQLQEAAAEADQIAAEKPAVATSLRVLEKAAQDAVQSLTTDRRPLAAPPSGWVSPGAVRPGTAPALLSALVMHGLRLAETDDPLRRADCCTRIADDLVRTILTASATGDADQAFRLGKHLGVVMDRGVDSNLTRAEATATEEARVEEIQRVSERATQATEVLEQNLEEAPDTARPGLERALEASGHNRDRSSEKWKGKGKSKGKGKGGRP